MFEGHQGIVNSLDFSHDGLFIVSGSADNTTWIWNMNTHESQVFPIDNSSDVRGDNGPKFTGMLSMAISPNDRFIATGSLNDPVMHIWDVATWTLVNRFRGHGDSVHSVTFMPDGKGLVSCSTDKTLKYWEFSAALSNAHETG